MNQVVMVGRLTQDPEIQETENGNKFSKLTIAIPRSFKNAEGVYETDFIPVDIWNKNAENTTEYCKKGDVVGIKGRLQNDNYEKDGEYKSIIKVQAERVTFLSSKSKVEPEPTI